MSREEDTNPEESPQLRSCRLCGKGISPYSLFCRNCGHPQGRPLVIALLIVFLVVLLALYVGFMLFCACNRERFEIHPAQPNARRRETDGDGTASVWPAGRTEVDSLLVSRSRSAAEV